MFSSLLSRHEDYVRQLAARELPNNLRDVGFPFVMIKTNKSKRSDISIDQNMFASEMPGQCVTTVPPY